MKRILILIIGLIGVAQAQYSPTSAKTKFVNGLSIGSKDSTYFTNAGDTVVLYIGRDSAVYTRFKGYHRKLAFVGDTTAMLSKYFRTTTQLNDTTFVINRPDATADTIQLSFLVPDTTGKLSIIDTSAMLAPYRRTSTKITNSDLTNSTISGISLGSNLNNLTAGNGLSGTAYNGGTAYTWQVDTSTISTKANVTGALVGYTTVSMFTDSLTNVQSRIQTKQPLGAYITLADSTTILSGRWLPNRSADSIAVIRALANSKGTGSVTSVATGVGLSGGTITTSGTISADTTTLSTRAYVTGQLVGYATTGNLALKLNISDTAAMLSNYRRTSTLIQQSEVSGLSTSLAAKLNISDTASMLSGYKTYYPRTAISAGTGITYDASTGVITNSSPSSGGTVTSVATNNGSGITGGTITSTGTIAADTTILSTKANVTGTLVGYTTLAQNALKVNISDTATMLSNYRRKTTLIENADLRNSAITINGSSTSLGGSISVGTVTSVAASAGTGISVSGSPITSSGTITITNTAPDQTVALTAGTGISVSGTYPNFTITNSSPSSGGTVTSIATSAPITGGTITSTGTIGITQSTTSTDGYLSSTDWNTFNDKASTASVALKLNISDTASMLSNYRRSTTLIENADLRNSAITINGSSTALGGSISVGTVTSVAASAGTGISISGSPITSSGTLTITNTAPDQTVTLTAGSGISVTGTYPNFTVINSSPSSGGTVTSVTASAPLSSSGGTTPNITISQATTSTNGFLTSTDWNTFNDKASTASVALKLNISDTAAMMSKSFRTTTQVNDTTFTINRPDGTKDTIALSVQVPSTSQLVYNTALTTDADYSLGLSDTYVQLVSTSTPRTLTLPAASTCQGRVVILNSKVGGGSGWTSTQTIYTTYPTTGGVTSLNGTVDTIISNGTNWIFLSRY